MIKVPFTFRALSPLYHGADIKTSNISLFRRHRVNLPESGMLKVQSKFKSEESRRRAIVAVLEKIYNSIPSDRKTMRIYDEFSSKLYVAAIQSNNQFSFLNKICLLFNIQSLYDEDIVPFLQNFEPQEFLQTVIDELQYLIAFMRLQREQRKEQGKNAGTLFEADKPETDAPILTFQKTYADVPYISGNAIRGQLRRLVMRDYCSKIGLLRDIMNTDESPLLPVQIYSQLFTGGTITESSEYENIEHRERFIQMCPPIGLLGSAIGNMTIRGKMITDEANIRCKEIGNGDKSFYEYLDILFSTRHDSVKLENEISIDETGKESSQMIYHQEVITPGAVFDCAFTLTLESSAVLQSCFWRGLELFKNHGFVGGKSAVGFGKVECDYEIPDGATDVYNEYVETHKAEMLEYLTKPVVKSKTGKAA